MDDTRILEGKEINMEQFSGQFIHVPQGKCVRFTQETKEYLGFEGLYTAGISTCNILVFWSENKVSLMHLDGKGGDILPELEWVGEPNKISLISRKNQGSLLRDQIIQLLQKTLPDQQIGQEELADNEDGIIVYLPKLRGENLDIIFRYIPREEKLKNIVRHPLEEKFQAVQKIEQVIGLRAIQLTKKMKYRTQVIFDGICWQPMSEGDLTIDMRHPATKAEMKTLTSNDPLVISAGKLAGIIQAYAGSGVLPHEGDMYETSLNVAFYLESYLNDFNHAEQIFIKNIKNLVTDEFHQPKSNQDKAFQNKLVQMVNEKKMTVEALSEVAESFQKQAPETDFKRLFLKEFNDFKKQYCERMEYKKVGNMKEDFYQSLAQKTQVAIAHSKDERYKDAAEIFLQIIKDATRYFLADKPELSTVYYNYGRSLYNQGDYNQSYFFLETALNLAKKYPHKDSINKEKVVSALNQCHGRRELPLSAASIFASPLTNTSTTTTTSPITLTTTTTTTATTTTTTTTINPGSPSPAPQ